jgi:hypothetical protein
VCLRCAADSRLRCEGRDDNAMLLQALRLVLAVALDRDTAADCIAGASGTGVALWPSSLYGVLAASAVRSPCMWCRCSRLVDASLGQLAGRFDATPPAALVELFVEGRDVLTCRELAALLWSLLRRRDPALNLLSERLGAEFEIVTAYRAGEGATRTSLPLLERRRAIAGQPNSWLKEGSR